MRKATATTSCSALKGPSAIMCAGLVCVVAAVAIGTGARPERSLAEEQRNQDPAADPSNQETPAIELFVDLSLGVCDEQEAKRRSESLRAGDLRASLDEEMEGLEGDLVGVRQVTAERFTALTRRMEIVSSGISITPLGVTRERAYLEVSVFLTSRHAYVAVVTTERVGLSKEVLDKLTHVDSPNAAAKKAAFHLRLNAISAKIDKAAQEYTQGKHGNVVRLLEGLDEEIDAILAEYPRQKSKWMLGVKQSAVYCLLAAAYRVQNEPEKSAKYEALFKKPFQSIGQDVKVDEFLRLVLQDAEVQFDLPLIEVEVMPGEVELRAVESIDEDE